MGIPCLAGRTTRWGVLAAASITAFALAVPLSAPAAVTASTDTGAGARTTFWSAESWGDPAADAAAMDTSGRNQASLDPGSLYTVENALGVHSLWSSTTGKSHVTGQGVGVALLDSGVSAVPGLTGAGKVTYGPDLSVEGNGVLAGQDTFGHGTFMAGIIAGRGTTDASSLLANEPPSVQLGIAPDAELLAVKLAATDGSTDVSQVIAGIDWVVQHPTLPDGTKVRVINLSYGTDTTQKYSVDPLAAAVENAWRHGIVVVASAGNAGSASGRLTDPAIDPYIVSVAALDNSDQPSGWNNPIPADFSSRGDGTRNPDFAAPGRSLVSLRSPGSFIDTTHSEGRVAGDSTATLFRGSGTSQAAALVSGTVALLLQAYPTLTPDQVKAVLKGSALPMSGVPATAVGAGRLSPGKAITLAGQMLGNSPTSTTLRSQAVQSFSTSTGLGSLQAARGSAVMVDADGNDITGELDVQGATWNPAAWVKASQSLTAWTGGQWLGETFTGPGWDPNTGGLTSARWSSARWSSARWSDANWSSNSWTSARWSSARWSSARWSSARWSSNDW